jgi:hypothetical protein
MKKNKMTVFISLLIPMVSFACSLFPRAALLTPTPENEPNFVPITDPLVIDPDSLPDGQAGEMYEITIVISQNVTPVGDMWIKEGELPVGLEFVFLNGEDSAMISGVPQETGTFNFTINVWCFGTMVTGQTLVKEYQIVVN